MAVRVRSIRDRLVEEYDLERLDFIRSVGPRVRAALKVAVTFCGGPADGIVVEYDIVPDTVYVDGEDGRYLPVFPDYVEMAWRPTQ